MSDVSGVFGKIACFFIVAGVVEQFMSGSGMKKYVKYFCGVVLALWLIYTWGEIWKGGEISTVDWEKEIQKKYEDSMYDWEKREKTDRKPREKIECQAIPEIQVGREKEKQNE